MSLVAVSGASASNASKEGVRQSSMGSLVELKSHVWGSVPEEVQRLIFKGLPPDAYCQFRCVSKDWYRLLSPPPDWTYWARTKALCSIVATLNQRRIRFLCHSNETKFLKLPSFKDLASKMNQELGRSRHVRWHLADVEEGLFCYYAIIRDEFLVAVCNPLTEVARLVTPERSGFASDSDFDFKVKLVVDREEKTFRIFVVEPTPSGMVAIFDSTTSAWKRHRCVFPRESNQFFVRENVLYAYTTDAAHNFVLGAIDISVLEKKRCAHSKVTTIQIPEYSAKNFIVQDGDETMLVRSLLPDRTLTKIWKLDIGPFHRKRGFELSLQSESSKTLVSPMAHNRHLTNVSNGPGYICLVYRAPSKRIDMTAPAHLMGLQDPDMIVKHSFESGNISVMASPSGWTLMGKLFPWASSVDADRYLEG